MNESPLPHQCGLSVPYAIVNKALVGAVWLSAALVFAGCATVSAGSNNLATSPTSAISIVPATVNFKEVVVGQKNSQTLQISNVGKQPLSLEALSITGQGFTLASGQAPPSLAPGASFSVTLAFAPTVASPLSGSLALTAVELKTPVSVALEGTGERPAPQLQVTPSSLNFGNTAIHSASWQNATLTNTGNIAVTIDSVTLSNPAFSLHGLSSGLSLAPGQSSEFKLGFQPTATGSATAALAVNSSSLSAPLKLAATGSGINGLSSGSSSSGASGSSTAHSVHLAWNPSSSPVLGYGVYRGSATGGPYVRLTMGPVAALEFSDATVQSSNYYFYVVTAIDASGVESAYSNEVSASVP